MPTETPARSDTLARNSLALPLAAGLALAALSGCNTTEGLGQDLENTGEAIEEEAEEAS
jgi:predicted small secreted protein